MIDETRETARKDLNIIFNGSFPEERSFYDFKTLQPRNTMLLEYFTVSRPCQRSHYCSAAKECCSTASAGE
jgi:hypothetical protein